MKNIYFVQASQMLSNSVFLPYAVGAIAAYSFQFEDIRAHYRLGKFIFRQIPVQDVIQNMDNPYMVAFSSYMWNIEYNLMLAAAVKQKWHDCLIVFGGPQVSEDMVILKENAYVDILSHGEGEQTTCRLLRALRDGDDLSTVNNISFRNGDALYQTPKSAPTSLDDYPSPYTLGYFDEILGDSNLQGIQFDAVIETNRGCPYGCIFCYWGGGQKKVLRFPEKKVKEELLWMAEHSISFCFCADSNFGILDRDEDFVDYIVELKHKYGFPQRFETIATKNKNERTLRINQKLHSVNLNRAVSIAVQTMDPKVLRVIGRENMGMENLESLYKVYRQNGIHTYTDLILGFPEETLESFCHGLFCIIEAGQHSLINIFRCELLPNTTYGSSEMVEKYHVRAIQSHLRQNHATIGESNGFGSWAKTVVSTDTLSMKEWEKALRISICVQSFHCLGLLRYIAIFLRKARNVSYESFYLSLYNWIETDSIFIKRTFDYVCATIKTFLDEKGDLYFADSRFGNIYWAFDEGLFLCCAVEIDDFYTEIKSFIHTQYGTDDDLDELIRYQKESIALPQKQPKTDVFHYDWKRYFDRLFDKDFCFPEKRKVAVTHMVSQNMSWEEYARYNVWYGRSMEKTIDLDVYVTYLSDHNH